MWVALFIRVLVMHAMRCDPENRTPFQSQRAAHGQNIFHPLRSLEAAMRKKTMVSNADTKAPCDPPQNHRERECLPAEQEQRSHSSNVKGHHDEGRKPYDGLRKRPVTTEDSRQSHIRSRILLMAGYSGEYRLCGNVYVTARDALRVAVYSAILYRRLSAASTALCCVLPAD